MGSEDVFKTLLYVGQGPSLGVGLGSMSLLRSISSCMLVLVSSMVSLRSCWIGWGAGVSFSIASLISFRSSSK